MNSLRDLLESLDEAVHMPASSTLRPEMLYAIADWCQTHGERATAFHLGAAERLSDLDAIPELVRLPFSTCWFEFTFPTAGPTLLCGLLMTAHKDGNQEGQVWTRLNGQWRFIGRIVGSLDQTNNWYIDAPGAQQVEVTAFAGQTVRKFLSALHCTNVTQREHKPDTALQKARAKRGKAPLFSYWTLELQGHAGRGPFFGGTHASPRVHLRRGHPRQYAPGKWTWVQPCAVGNKQAGIVHKDYIATPALFSGAATSARHA